MNKVQIKVIRTAYYEEFAEKYLTDEKDVGPCPYFQVGDTFIFEGGAQMPEGFCPWAWIDIYHNVSSISSGSTYTPWNKREGETVVCCTDGIRPVSFEVKKI